MQITKEGYFYGTMWGMNKLLVDESAGSALGKITGKKKWKARLIGVGRGSKALYTTEAMETAKVAFPAGTKVNADHMSWREKDERPEGSIKSIIGVIASEPVAESDGAYAEIEFIDEWAPKMEQIAPYVGLSIHAQVEWSEETEDGLPIVTAFVPYPLNSVDVVTEAGAKGKLLEVMESLSNDIIDTDANNERKKKSMTPEEMKSLAALIVSEVTEALKPEPKSEPKDSDEGETVGVAEVAEAMIVAGLPEIARKQVYADIANGTAVEEAITAQKTYIDGLTKFLEVEESDAKRKMSGDNKKEMNFELGAWS